MQIILPDVAPQPLILVVSLREVWMTKQNLEWFWYWLVTLFSRILFKKDLHKAETSKQRKITITKKVSEYI